MALPLPLAAKTLSYAACLDCKLGLIRPRYRCLYTAPHRNLPVALTIAVRTSGHHQSRTRNDRTTESLQSSFGTGANRQGRAGTQTATLSSLLRVKTTGILAELRTPIPALPKPNYLSAVAQSDANLDRGETELIGNLRRIRDFCY
jgi:hypothetical protein